MINSTAITEPNQEFQDEVTDRIRQNLDNENLRAATSRFNQISTELKYSYNFEWFGRPIIQYPQDICALQDHFVVFWGSIIILSWRIKDNIHAS